MFGIPQFKKPTDDARAKKVRKAIKPLLVWIGALQQWRITLSFDDEFKGAPRIADCAPVARIAETYPYRNVNIQFTRAFVDDADAVEIEEVVIHELMHVLLTYPIRRYLEKKGVEPDEEFRALEESLVELPTMWLERLRPDKGFVV